MFLRWKKKPLVESNEFNTDRRTWFKKALMGVGLVGVATPAFGAQNLNQIYGLVNQGGTPGNPGTGANFSYQLSLLGRDLGYRRVVNRATMAAFTGQVAGDVASLTEAGREGLFTWNASVSNLVGANVVSSAVVGNTITSAAHGYKTGDAILSNSAVNGLAVNTIYYVIRVNANDYRIATTFANAQGGTAFTLTGTSATTTRRQYDPQQGIFVTPPADLTGASGAWKRQALGDVNPRWFGALGNGSNDDSPAFQGALDMVQDRILGNQVYVTLQNSGQQYNLNYSLRIAKKCMVQGESKGVLLYYAGAIPTTPIFWLDGTIAPNLENVTIQNIALDTNTTNRADAFYVFNAAFNTFRDLYISNCRIGINMLGTRNFSNLFEGVHTYGGTSSGIIFADGFAGGGIHTFVNCTVQAPIGIDIAPTALIKAISMTNCGFEQCSITGFRVRGTAYGITFHGGYTEKCGGSSSIQIIPVAGQAVYGFKIDGVSFETDGESYAVLLGAASGGNVEGFTIQNCAVEDYGTAMVRYDNANVLGGLINTNRMNNTATVTSNGPATNVTLNNNRNSTGAISA